MAPLESVDDATPAAASCGSVGAMATTWAELTRPGLRDGLRVVRRDDAHLQVGLDPPDRLVLVDRPGLHEALAHLHRRPPDHLCDLVDGLVADGWVVDAASGSRRTSDGDGLPVALQVDRGLEDAVVRTCAAAGLRRSPDAPTGPTQLTHLVVTVGEPSRSLSDALVRHDVPHLWLAVFAGAVRIGPYVEPGRTACLRCVDAHLGDLDPRRATVLQQLEDLPPVASPLDPCLVQVGVGWAVRDLRRRLDGHDPALRSASVTVTRDLEVTRRDWLRHPHCGCAWG